MLHVLLLTRGPARFVQGSSRRRTPEIEYNATNYRVSFFYDLAKAAVNRMAFALAHELEPHGATAVSLTPGWLRSEAMLEAYGFTDLDGSRPDAWRYVPEVQDAGKRRYRLSLTVFWTAGLDGRRSMDTN